MIELFPLYGVTLGKTTFADAKDNADKVFDNPTGFTINGVAFLEVAGEDSIRYAVVNNRCEENYEVPQKWRNALGLNWGMSNEECLSILESKDFCIESLTEECVDYPYIGKRMIVAITPDSSFVLELILHWKKGLCFIMVSVNDCPHCKSKDIEIKTDDKTLRSFLICNECGHRWGRGDLEEETE